MGNGRILYMVVAMRYKGRVCVFDVLFLSIIHVYVCLVYFLCVSSVSSPYLLVIGDDHVRDTREQVMMQVELVRLSCGEGMIMRYFSLCFLYVFFILFEMDCKGS